MTFPLTMTKMCAHAFASSYRAIEYTLHPPFSPPSLFRTPVARALLSFRFYNAFAQSRHTGGSVQWRKLIMTVISMHIGDGDQIVVVALDANREY